MSDSARDLLTRGIAAAKADEPEQAKKYLLWSLRNQPDDRQRVDALYWMARLTAGEQRETYLLQVLQIEPTHYAARRDLAILKGELDEADVVDPLDPDKPQPPAQIDPQQRRFDCPQCGGHMEHDASQRRLLCRYCGYALSTIEAIQDGASVAEEDFIHALATAKGHLHPQSTAVVECEGCGASYLLEPNAISFTCAHCGSSYAVTDYKHKDLIPPQGVIPFSIERGQAGRRLRAWLDDQRINGVRYFGEIRGLYLPIWTFDVTGEAPYHYQRYDGEEWVNERGTELLLYNDLPVVASQRLPKHLADEIHSFDLSQMQSYDASQIAGWPAETYQLPARSAAMAARWFIVDRAKRQVKEKLYGRIRDLQLQSSALFISAYRLALLPFWLASYSYASEIYHAVINGQNGNVRAEQPLRGIGGWLRDLLDPND